MLAPSRRPSYCAWGPLSTTGRTNEAHRQNNSAIDGLRNELKAEIATKASTEDVDALRTEVGGLRTEVGDLRTEVGDLRTEVRDGFRAIGEQIRRPARISGPAG